MLDPAVDTEWYREAELRYFRANLRAVIDGSGVSVAAACKEMGVSRWMISGYLSESKDIMPRLDTLQKIADYYDIEVADLFLPPAGSEEDTRKMEAKKHASRVRV